MEAPPAPPAAASRGIPAAAPLMDPSVYMDPRVIVIDWSSALVKAGFAGDAAPRSIPAVVACLPPSDPKGHWTPSRGYHGYEALAKAGILRLDVRWPLVAGRELTDRNASDISLLARLIYDWDLSVAPDQHCHVHSVPTRPAASPADAAAFLRMHTRVPFEDHGVPALCLASDASLAVLGSGRTTGVAVNVGEGLLSATPVYEGHALAYATARGGRAGAEITQCLAQLLTARGTQLSAPELRQAKEALAYVAPDFDAELAKDPRKLERSIQSSDRLLTLSTERFRCAEILFRPPEGPSLPQLIAEAIGKCPAELRPEMWDNVILHGGSAQIPGLAHRTFAELRRLAPPGACVRVIAAGADLVFLGGCVLGSLVESHPGLWVTRQEWEDEGLHRVVRHWTM